MSQLTPDLAGQALEQAPAAIAIVVPDPDPLFRYANAAFRALTGASVDLVGQPLTAILPGLADTLGAAVRTVIASGEPTRFNEFKAPAADAAPAYWDVQVTPLDSNGDGRPDAATIFIEDVTGNVRVHRALAEQESRFRLAQELSLDGYAILRAIRDAAGSIVDFNWIYANPAAFRMHRLSPEELVGRTLLQTLPGARAAGGLFQMLVDVVESGRPADHEVRYQNDGIDGWFRVLVIKVGDGVATSLLDITESKQAQQALAAAEARLQLALEAANMGAWEQDLVHHRVAHSRSLTTLLGLPPSDGPTATCDLLRTMLIEDYAACTQIYHDALAGGSDDLRLDFRVRHPDGSLRWLQSCGRFIRDDCGRPYKVTGVAFDVTEQRQQRERLEHFARAVAHDLKAPLQSIVSFAELVQRLATDRLQPHESRCLGRIGTAALQMDEMIDGLLDYARATRSDLIPQPVPLNQVFEQALERLEPAIREANATVTRGSLPVVLGNRVLLTQVLQNLIGNALKFRSEQPLRVHVSSERTAERLVIAVRDNGIGIPPERRERLFQAFVRAHDDGGYPGLGLGLALVRDAVEHHGGQVWVDSTVGRGSTFYFSLPATAEARAAEAC